jgi:hypothetical protein
MPNVGFKTGLQNMFLTDLTKDIVVDDDNYCNHACGKWITPGSECGLTGEELKTEGDIEKEESFRVCRTEFCKKYFEIETPLVPNREVDKEMTVIEHKNIELFVDPDLNFGYHLPSRIKISVSHRDGTMLKEINNVQRIISLCIEKTKNNEDLLHGHILLHNLKEYILKKYPEYNLLGRKHEK